MAARERVSREEIRVLFKSRNPNVDEERCSGSCSSSSSATKSSKWKVDPMVESELDAARALADFAQLALLQCGNTGNTTSESSRNWGNKGRRSKKRVKKETNSTLSEWGKNFETSKLKTSDLVQDSTVEDNQCHKKVRKSVTTRTIKVEQDLELPRSTPQCSTSCVSSAGGRSKHQLTEAEKEAKRLRRILANRESARQTIRRRQAMCEELTRKAADLASENESMKREKELIMKEYQLLKDTNERLKVQIAKSIKVEEEGDLTPVKAVASSSEKQQPLVVFNNRTVAPMAWPSVIQPLNPIQTQPLLHESMVPVCKIESSDEQGSLPGANGLRHPYYIVPCPWFFPLGNGLYPHPLDSFGIVNKQEDISFINSSDQKPLKDSTNVENHPPSSPRKVAMDATSPDTTIRLAPGEENQSLGSHPCGSNQLPPSVKPCEPTIKSESRLQQDSTAKEESGSSTGSHNATIQENNKGHNVYHRRKMVDAVVAAEARKRRKELTRLKNLNGRQLRLHC